MGELLMKCLDRASLVADRSVTLGDIVARLAAVHGDRALVEEPAPDGSVRRLTYREAARFVELIAAGVAARTRPGECVVVATPNGYDQLLVALGVCRAGGIAVPVNPLMRPEEIAHVVADSGASLVVHDAGEVPAIGPLAGAEIETRRPDVRSVAAIFYTSGTTGKPKGAELSHRALLGSLPLLALVPSGLRRDELVAGLPVAHIMGFAVLLAAAAGGIPVFAMPRFRAEQALDAIEHRRATMFVGVPAMYRLLLEAGAEHRDLSSVRVWASGADVMPADLARRFQRMGGAVTLPLVGLTVGDAAFVEGYGMVETGGAVAAKVAPPGLALPLPFLGGILGVALPGYRLKVVGDDGDEVGIGQIGELLVRGPGVLSGYHGDASATAQILDAGGWLRTGDLARRGVLGTVRFAGRAKDVIKSGGYSVYAVEIERAMEEHPDVIDAAARGVPDDRLGERPVVAVRVREGASTSEPVLLAWGTERLSGYKRPRAVRIVTELPRTGTQKVAKAQLRTLFDG
ncbi:MAG: long-chain fatty acid--CoA ligase [Acidimicrobiales bacterium]